MIWFVELFLCMSKSLYVPILLLVSKEYGKLTTTPHIHYITLNIGDILTKLACYIVCAVFDNSISLLVYLGTDYMGVYSLHAIFYTSFLDQYF